MTTRNIDVQEDIELSEGRPSLLRKGNIVKDSASGVWMVWNGTRGVTFQEYLAINPDGNQSVMAQQQALSDIQGALYTMDVVRVLGEGPRAGCWHWPS